MTSQESQLKPPGNTKTGGLHNQLYRWTFTIPYDVCTASQLSQLLKDFAKEFYFQGEKGESGYLHWQGCFSLKTKEYFGTVKNLLPNKSHIEKVEDWFACKKYCTKEESRIEGPYDINSVFIKTIEKLYDWQIKLRDICLTEPDDRTIHWIWEKNGCKGKSAFCKYMLIKHNAYVFNNGKTADIAYTLNENPKIILFDLPRTIEGLVNYTALEQIKNGMIFSGKYESKMKVFNSPHVMIFANFPPDKTAMSLDRWNIIEL